MSRDMNLISCTLSGTKLIEANAGTGKTYTITALAARMIIEKEFTIDRILVVTFTKAAAGDLKAKILDRLVQLKKGFEEGGHKDEFVSLYLKSCPVGHEKAVKLLASAIRDFDTNSIFTIHAFCQRMLTENSFSGKIAFGTELTGSTEDILIRPVRDFWRRCIYSLPIETAEKFSSETPETLTDFLIKLNNSPTAKIINTPEADEKRLTELKTALNEAFNEVRQYPEEEILALFRQLYREDGTSSLHKSWSPIESFRAAVYSIIFSIKTGLNSFKDKINKKNGYTLLTDEMIKRNTTGKKTPLEHPFFVSMSKWKRADDEYKEALRISKTSILISLKKYTDEVLPEYKLRLNSQSYGDLVERMHSAVVQENGLMAKNLAAKFSAALIDEFQDTDPLQYGIFDKVFGAYDKPFFMIGDPKQAIYSFRGADIFTYLKASGGKDPLTLSRNHRSDKDLVSSVNRLFSSDNSFLLNEISYFDSEGKHSFPVHIGSDRIPPLTIWHTEKATKESLAGAVAFSISDMLNKNAQITLDDGTRGVVPSDFAVLTRSRGQAKAVRDFLEKYSIPCVITGSENVFASMQAVETAKLLRAAVNPHNEEAVRTALATDIFGYDAVMLMELMESEKWEAMLEHFSDLSDILFKKGIAPMFFYAAKMHGLYKRLAGAVQGERKLTNFIHLTELAQEHEAEKNASPQELLIWFVRKIGDSDKRIDSYELKMDSDENAVTITTIHKSKGLEYNIVFTPFLMLATTGGGGEIYARYHADGELIVDMRADEEAYKQEKAESLAEDIRIAYVALTRAKALCFTAWGTAQKGNGNTAFMHLFHKGQKYDYADLHAVCSGIEHINLCGIPETSPARYAAERADEPEHNRIFTSKITLPWSISSFSGLIHSTSSVRDTEQSQTPSIEHTDRYNIFTFPKGAKAGSCLHEIMENIPLESPDSGIISSVTAEKLDKYGIEAEFVPCVAEKIGVILSSELADGIRLKGLSDGEYVHEMEFHICTKPFEAKALTDIFTEYGLPDFASSCSVLDFRAIQGFLTGFSDLIFVRNGRYYILDWKSNHLGHTQDCYTHERMHEEMLKSHYYLQLYIYTLALHKHLKNSLSGYSYETHIGGGLYLFMRGVGDGNGVYFHRPPFGCIEKMDRLMSRT